MSPLPQLWQALADLLAPFRCLVCGREVSAGPRSSWEACLCPDCRGKVEGIGGSCRGCGRHLGAFAKERRRCSACRGHSLGGIRSTTALFRYRAAGRTLLRRLKYGDCEELGLLLGKGLAQRFRERSGLNQPAAACVVPIPLHPLRRWRRGFNQSERIAEGVAGELGLPLLRALSRRKATPPLYGVPKAQREGRLRGAFALRGAALKRPVLLVDDIRTSGATLRAAARALRRRGTRRIDALVVAR